MYDCAIFLQCTINTDKTIKFCPATCTRCSKIAVHNGTYFDIFLT